MLCVEYVDEVWKSPDDIDILTKDPFNRAKAKIVADEISKNVRPNYYKILLRQTAEERNKARDELLESLRYISCTFMSSSEETFLYNGNIGYADICLAPFALRFDVALSHYRQFFIPKTSDYEHYNSWWDRIKNNPILKSTSPTNEQLLEIYRSYADNTAPSKARLAVNKGEVIP